MNIYKFRHPIISMRKILVIIDGLGDTAHDKFKGKTPLEYADMPNLDMISRKSRLGFMYPVNEDYAPESDTAIVSILGNNFDMSERAEFEALGAGIKFKRGDLVLRANFGTVEDLKSRKMVDRRAGRTLTTNEAKQLAKALNEKINLPVKFQFFPTVQHRGILVFYGGFSDNITNTDTYVHEKGKIWIKNNFDWSKPLDDDENSEFATNLVNAFVDNAYKVLNEHPVNKIRIKRGLLPANIVLTRDAGVEMPKLNLFRKSMAIVTMPLEKGIAKASGMEVFSLDYPEMKNYDVYENLHEGLEKLSEFAIKTLKKKKDDYNFCYVHFKETDVPGHDNKPFEKKIFLELLDKKFFAPLKEYIEKSKIKLIVTGDHSTPCKMKTHTSDPVPVLLYNPEEKGDDLTFGETNSRKGSLGKIYGKNILKKTDFV
ncbi:MAG: alkaline phosphatase family protein [archaeon]|nr:alkaline phosphatase family protein [archaeon]